MKKSWPEGQGNGEGQSITASPAVPSVTVPVSSPTVASTSFLASPNFDVISLSSLRLTTLTKTFTCLEAGVKSLTFVIALSSMFSLLPTQDARVAKAGKTVSRRIQTMWADCSLRVPPIITFGSGGAQHRDVTHRSRPRANSFDVGTIFLPRLHLPMRAHARRRIRTRSHGHPRQRHEAM